MTESFPLPVNEENRLKALLDYNILDTFPEQAYDDFTKLASVICGTPIALISLLDDHRQWFKARMGLEVSETPREFAFCTHAIMAPGQVMVVNDATKDSRFSSNPLVVSDPDIRFYAGAPLVTSKGEAIGTICVIDRQPREITVEQIEALKVLSREIMVQLELRRSINSLEKKEQILACDFFTIDTVWFQTIYVLFFIELGSRRIHFAGITSNPNQTWITQQARQLVWELHDMGRSLQFLIHDNDCSFSKAFDDVFEAEGIHIIHTPFLAPNANAHAERWVRTVREECLDHILIINAEHLRRVLIKFSQYYNTSRPHQGINQQMPIPPTLLKHTGFIQRRKILGGIINDYFRSADRYLPSIP